MNTHKVTFVEPIDFVELAKKNLEVKELQLTVSKEIFDTLYRYMCIIFDKFEGNPDELIELLKVAKELDCVAMSSNLIDFLEENYPVAYQEYKDGKKSDFTGGSLGSDNR